MTVHSRILCLILALLPACVAADTLYTPEAWGPQRTYFKSRPGGPLIVRFWNPKHSPWAIWCQGREASCRYQRYLNFNDPRIWLAYEGRYGCGSLPHSLKNPPLGGCQGARMQWRNYSNELVGSVRLGLQWLCEHHPQVLRLPERGQNCVPTAQEVEDAVATDHASYVMQQFARLRGGKLEAVKIIIEGVPGSHQFLLSILTQPASYQPQQAILWAANPPGAGHIISQSGRLAKVEVVNCETLHVRATVDGLVGLADVVAPCIPAEPDPEPNCQTWDEEYEHDNGTFTRVRIQHCQR